MTKQTPLSSRRARAGFTLAEVMVATIILGFLSLGMYQFTMETSRSLFTGTEKLEINRDVRQVTAQLMQTARDSNDFLIYESFEYGDRDDELDRQGDGQTGDFLLLPYMERWPTDSDPQHYTRLVGYFRRPDPSDPENRGPVYRFEIDYPEGSYKNAEVYTPESLISNLNYNGDYTQVLELSRGLANGRLFYNFYGSSVMVKAEILHGNEAKRITDTYNFTISPRN